MTSTEDENANTDRTDGSRRADDGDSSNQTGGTNQQVTATQQSENDLVPGVATRRRYLGIVGAMVGSTGLSGLVGARQSGNSYPADPFASGRDRGSIPGLRRSRTGSGLQSETDETGTLDAPETLTELWRQDFSNETIGPATFSGTDPDTLFSVGTVLEDLSSGVTVYAINESDGSISWSNQINSNITPILAHEPGRALYYTDTGTGDLVAADTSSGDDLWRTSISAQSFFPPGVYYINETNVYFVAGTNVAAYDKTNGEEQWSETVDGTLYPFGTFDDGGTSLMYVVSITNPDPAESKITAIDRTDGSVEWSATRSLAPGINILADDTLYAAFNSQNPDQPDTELVAYNKDTGDVKWTESRADDLRWSLVYPVSNTSSAVYAFAGRNENGDSPQSQGVAARFDETGTKEWEYDAGGLVVGFARGTDSVYTASRDGQIASVDDDTASADFGTEEWSESIGSSIRDAGLWKSDDVLYTGTVLDSGSVYALDATDGSTLDEFSLGAQVAGGITVYEDQIWAVGRSPYDGNTGDSAIYKLGDGGDDPWYAAYTNQNGVVETSGLDSGITDLRDGLLSVTRLRTLMDSWGSGQPVSP